MTKNPSDELVISPSPKGALCLAIEAFLAWLSSLWTPSAVAYAALGHPLFSVLVSAYLGLKNPLFLLLTLLGVARMKRGRCWPVWKGVYCCSAGGSPWFALVREG